MQFWTALQEPFSQAALVVDGHIVKRIPDHPPKTPIRKVDCVAEFDGNLVIGRRSHLELWKPDGSEMLASLYHPWIFGLHEVQQYKDMFLVACAGIDCLFLMDQDGRTKWSWWAHQYGWCPKIEEIESPNWEVMQTTYRTYDFLTKECHLNSARVFGDEAIISLMLKEVILAVPLAGNGSRQLGFGFNSTIHSPIITSTGQLAYGRNGGVHLPTGFVGGFDWVKRVYQTSDGSFIFTHEAGVTTITGETISGTITLPRPFGIALLEE